MELSASTPKEKELVCKKERKSTETTSNSLELWWTPLSLFYKILLLNSHPPALDLGGSYHLATGVWDTGSKSIYSCIYP